VAAANRGASRPAGSSKLRAPTLVKLLVRSADSPVVVTSTPHGYQHLKLLRASPHSTIYTAVRDEDGADVLLKTYSADRPGAGRSRARSEFDMLQRVQGPGVPKALDLDHSGQRPVLVLERVPGSPLTTVLEEGPLDLTCWLSVAIAATEILAGIHSKRVLHKDLTPENLLFDRHEQSVWICDFGLAVELGAAVSRGEPIGPTVAATLGYISPEQTGRMNRGCDCRSDLYSLGATLYHALTGRPPFQSRDPLELVHSQLARLPEDPTAVRADVPLAFAEILMRLLRKEPDERYQSAESLHRHLCACRDELSRSGMLSEEFVLGEADAPEAPRFTTKTYGRDRELEELRSLYRHVAQGESQVVWLEGPSGVGKSTLVDQLRPLLPQTGGYLAVGKFDLYADRPYAAWASALESLVHQILIESDDRLQSWQTELARALGPVAGALVDLVPDLRFILKEVPRSAPLDAREAQARLALALQRLFSACATVEHPLVLFLDDLQWSDPGSRALLLRLLEVPPPALMLIGAYREAPGDDAFRELIDHSCDRTSVTSIQLAPLSPSEACQMLAAALERTPADVEPLAALASARTENLPNLLRGFVEHLHAQSLLRYRSGAGWVWELDEIMRVGIPDSALELMRGKLARLSAGARAALDLASCIGDEFDLDMLRELSGLPHARVSEAVYEIADLGLIVPSAKGFRFTHDAIRERVHEMLADSDRGRIHHDAARLLLAHTEDPENSPRAVAISEHLNRVPELPPDLLPTAIRLNLAEGRKALALGAAATAADHFGTARGQLAAADANLCQELSFEIYMSSAESAFQMREFERALEFLAQIDTKPLSVLSRARVESKRIQIFALCRDPTECVRHALAAMRELGVHWPLHPSRLRAKLDLWRIRREISRSRRSDLLVAASSVPERKLAILILLRPVAAALARVDVNLAVLGTCLSMREHLRYGYLLPPAFPIAVYATYLYVFLHDRTLAERLAKISLAWARSCADPAAPRARMMIEVILYPFLMPRRQAFRSIDAIVESAREAGDLEFAHYARFNWTCYCALAGDPVAKTAARYQRMSELVRETEQWAPEIERCRNLYVHLANDDVTAETVAEAYGTEFRSGAMIEPGRGLSGTLWLMVLTCFSLYQHAFEHSLAMETMLFRTAPFVHVVDHVFYQGLASAVLAGNARRRVRRRYLRYLRKSIRYLERHARNSRDFVHLETLLRAEHQRLTADPTRARSLYESAALRARDQGFPHHSAMAHERHADMVAELRRDTEATAIARRAVAAYRDWGAAAKAQQLIARYPLLKRG